jgi:riboflavin biosynthesis pyrimidine reductase
MSEPHTAEGQKQRAKRLREQIEALKTGTGTQREHTPSLREQIEDRAAELRKTEKPGS